MAGEYYLPAMQYRKIIMHYRKISLLYTLIIPFSFLFSFLFINSVSSIVPLGTDSTTRINNIPESDTAQSLAHYLIEQADIHHIGIAQYSNDISNASQTVVLLRAYTSNTELPVSRWINNEYPNFNPGYPVIIEKLDTSADFYNNPRGNYLLYGETENIRGFISDVSGRLGTPIVNHNIFSIQNILGNLSTIPSIPAFIATLFLHASLLFSEVIGSSKLYAQQRLAGASTALSLRKDLSLFPAYSLFSTGASLLLSWIALTTYNSGAFYSLYLSLALLLALGSCLLLLAIHSITLTAQSKLSISLALKGKKPVRFTYWGTQCARLGCGVLAILSINSIISSTHYINSNNPSIINNIRENGGYYTLFRASRTTEQDSQNINSWIQDELINHNVILAFRDKSLAYTYSPDNPLPSTGEDIIYINKEYIETHPEVPEIIRERILEDPTKAQVHMPASSQLSEKDIHRIAISQIFQGQDSKAVAIVRYEGTASLNTYGSWGSRETLPTHNPIIVYIPQEELLQAPDNVLSYLSGGNAVLKDNHGALQRLDNTKAALYIDGIVSVAAEQARYIQDAQSERTINIYSLMILIFLIFISTTEYMRTYIATNTQRIFRNHIHGKSGYRDFIYPGIIELSLIILLFAYTMKETERYTGFSGLFSLTESERLDSILFIWLSFAILALLMLSTATLTAVRGYRADIARNSRSDYV